MTRSRTAKSILLGCIYLTLFVGVLYFVLPPRLFLNHDGARLIKKGMTLAEVESVLGGPEGVYFPTYQGAYTFRETGLIWEGPPRVHRVTQRVWYDDRHRYDVFFDANGRVWETESPLAWSSKSQPLLSLVFVFSDWMLISVTLVLIPRVFWKPRRVNHHSFDRIEVGMTRAEVQWLLGGPPGIYYPTYEGASTRSSGPAYEGPTGTLALDWWDSTERFTVYFDDEGRVVGKHSPEEWRSTAYTCRLAAMLFGSREPTPLPPRQFDGMMNEQCPTA